MVGNGFRMDRGNIRGNGKSMIICREWTEWKNFRGNNFSFRRNTFGEMTGEQAEELKGNVNKNRFVSVFKAIDFVPGLSARSARISPIASVSSDFQWDFGCNKWVR